MIVGGDAGVGGSVGGSAGGEGTAEATNLFFLTCSAKTSLAISNPPSSSVNPLKLAPG